MKVVGHTLLLFVSNVCFFAYNPGKCPTPALLESCSLSVPLSTTRLPNADHMFADHGVQRQLRPTEGYYSYLFDSTNVEFERCSPAERDRILKFFKEDYLDCRLTMVIMELAVSAWQTERFHLTSSASNLGPLDQMMRRYLMAKMPFQGVACHLASSITLAMPKLSKPSQKQFSEKAWKLLIVVQYRLQLGLPIADIIPTC